MVKKLIARVSAIFLLPVFGKSVIFNDFRAIVHHVSAREDGNTACWKAMVRSRTVDDSVAYWFTWKHPMARRQGLEFGVLDQTPRKWARQLGPTGLVARSSFCHKTSTAKASVRPFGPRHSSLSAPLHENTTLSSVANAPGPSFSPPRRLPRGLGHAALDSDHAECECYYPPARTENKGLLALFSIHQRRKTDLLIDQLGFSITCTPVTATVKTN